MQPHYSCFYDDVNGAPRSYDSRGPSARNRGYRQRNPVNAHHHDARSRYGGGRYEPERRSRSPRERSPYADKYGDDRRRQSVDTRTNPAGFQSGRDNRDFRDPVTGRDPPRAPKALLDSPGGPRGGGFGGDFRGRGRGGPGGAGRGRGWRDDSRDRGRDREPDYRDRPHFREDRSRDRERDWRDRERDNRDGFRGRRPSPQGRGRSPVGRDFRERDVPLGVDAERARRGSRDGPLSAGSSSSDPPFGAPYRGGFARGARGGPPGGGRGRGDWDRGGGRGRGGNFYDDRGDRYGGGPRSRSQEGRWARDPEDRDRREPRFNEPPRDMRDERDLIRDRDRDLIRPKPDRVSHEPPATKDVSPPPLAPSAPAFGSVPSRQPSSTDIQSLTGKPPPTGPRALTEERPVSAGHAVGSDRPPPTGPKPVLPDGPQIPVGPRAQQQKQQQRSSKQWINPAIAGKKMPDSPKIARSQSFVSQQQRPFPHRPESSHSDYHGDFDRRPRSSDAQSESHSGSTDGQLRGLHISGPNDGTIKLERGTQSARASVDREPRGLDGDVKMGGMDAGRPERDQVPAHREMQSASPTTANAPAAQDEAGEVKDEARPKTKRTIPIPVVKTQLPDRNPVPPAVDESTDSDTDEDMDDYFEAETSKLETELRKLEDSSDGAPTRIVARYATVLHESMLKVANDPVSLTSLLGPLSEGFSVAQFKAGQPIPEPVPEEAAKSLEAIPAREPSAIPTVEAVDEAPQQPDLQPKVEEVEMEGSGLPILPTVEEPKESEDVDMQDVSETQDTLAPLHSVPASAGLTPAEGLGIFPPFQLASEHTSPSAMDEDSEDRTEDDASIYGSVDVVREYSPTPPTEDLPIFRTSKQWYESKRVLKLAQQSPDFSSFLMGRIKEQAELTHNEQAVLKEDYRGRYDAYLRFTESNDPAAIKSRDNFAGVTPIATTGKAAQAAEPKPEGGRRNASRWASELDFATVIEQSRREHQEKADREARAQKEKYRTEKEAVIPDMFWTEEEKQQELFYDTAGLLPVEKLVTAWHVVPWHVNFTEEEAELFEKAYLESPKQWGKIANELPRRDFRACIQYYYAKKRELNLKEKLRKQPKRRKKGRGKQRSSALVSELGNAENDAEEPAQETENGERRRPRRAAAPTWGYEAAPNADSDGPATATPGRRRGAGAAAAANAEAKGDSGAEKTEVKKGRRARQPKADKEPKVPKPAPTLAPTPAAAQAKGNRSRSNSRAQGPGEWTGEDANRHLTQFNLAPNTMQPPTLPVQPQSLASPPPPLAPGLTDVMAPPQLRPEPPPPLASVPTFDIGQPSGSERIRSAQQASSYWSVSESTEFPGYLRAFGTDWSGIANHMQTKTAVMVKNFFVRQKEGGKPEWEQIAAEADAKRARGEQRPTPPMPSVGPRKTYRGEGPASHRPLAVAESDEPAPKAEPPAASQPFRFQVPLAPVSHPPGLSQAPPSIATPITSPAPLPQKQPPSGPPVAQVMSPTPHSLRPPAPPFAFQEKEREPAPPLQSVPVQAPPQPVRIISQKPAPVPVPVSEPVSRQMAWTADVEQQLSMHTQPKEPRERAQPRPEISPRESLRPVEQRPPTRLKQEPEPLHPEAYQQFQQRALPRAEPPPPARQEPPRVAPAPQPFSQPIQPVQPTQAQPVRSLLSEAPPVQQIQPAPVQQPPRRPMVQDTPMSGMPRQMAPSLQEQYVANPVSTQPPPAPAAPPPAPRPAEPRKQSNLFALLNDDPTPPPKRVSDVAAAKPNPTPPPQPISARPPQPPTSAPVPQRREPEPQGYQYPRNPQAPSAIPPLKPSYQSPQPQHMNAPRSAIAPSMDPGAAERDYYSRHQFPPQHQTSVVNSPQTHQAHHYPQQTQHAPQHAQQQQQQQQQMPGPYQAQQQYQGYQVPQHAASPTPQYAPHPSMPSRREPPPSTREAWPQPQAAGAPSMQQQQHPHQHPSHPQQHQQHPPPHQQHPQHPQHQQQTSWPPPQAPPKTQAQPVPQPSAWATQHAPQHAAPPKPQVNTSMASQHSSTSWPSAGPPQSHPLNLREPPRASPYGPHDGQSPTAGMVSHQHSGSIGGGRYAQPPDPRRIEQVPQPSQPYRYGTPGPGQSRDPARSYTPVGFDPRGPPQQQYTGQQDLREVQMREAQMREAQMAREREMSRDPAAQHQSILSRQLRPHEGYERPPTDRRYG
ncbi:hypothetical protein OQA88_3324 [Cercophora sp. LCS_1]